MKLSRVNVDRWGAVAGTICAIHCVLSGFALGLLSWFGLSFIGSEVTEWTFIAVALSLGVVAVTLGVRKHHSWVPASFFIAGMGCIGISHFVVTHATPTGAVLSALAGVCLVAFHILNQRYSRACKLTSS